MTRINCGIPVSELTDKHLLAEAREIKRIPNNISKGKYNLEGIPNKFKLGRGHVKFFYDKLFYLKKRYNEIYSECKRRGFKVTYFGNAWNNVPLELMNDYNPTEEDKNIVKQRIQEKINNSVK